LPGCLKISRPLGQRITISERWTFWK